MSAKFLAPGLATFTTLYPSDALRSNASSASLNPPNPIFPNRDVVFLFRPGFVPNVPPSFYMTENATTSLPSSSERSSSSALQMEVKDAESDEEMRRVPDFGSDPVGPSTSDRTTDGGAATCSLSSNVTPASQRKRGRTTADKEQKRLKRLLRNRVSAQQARERKKAYLNDLEARVKELEGKNSELEERLSTLQNENHMLRQILKNTTVGRRGTISSENGEVRY